MDQIHDENRNYCSIALLTGRKYEFISIVPSMKLTDRDSKNDRGGGAADRGKPVYWSKLCVKWSSCHTTWWWKVVRSEIWGTGNLAYSQRLMISCWWSRGSGRFKMHFMNFSSPDKFIDLMISNSTGHDQQSLLSTEIMNLAFRFAIKSEQF